MDMKMRMILGIVMVALAMTVAAGTQAKDRNSRNVLVPYDGAVAGSHLASGRYDVQWVTHSPEATVTFQQASKVVATVEGKVVDRGTKYSNNQVIYDEKPGGTPVISEIRFAGSREVIVFNQ
jgi:hypothetical protein